MIIIVACSVGCVYTRNEGLKSPWMMGGPLVRLGSSATLIHVLLWPLLKSMAITLGGSKIDDLRKGIYTFYPAKWVEASKKFSILLVATIMVASGGHPGGSVKPKANT